MLLEECLTYLRRLAPESLAESWDKVGLHLGDPAWRVERAMLCIDLTEAVMNEALAQQVQLIVAYHPPIFTPLPALTTATSQQRTLLAAAGARIAIYSPHTALDAAADGINDWLVSCLGPGDRQPIVSVASPAGYKVVTFVPAAHADALRQAMAAAGAGRIGAYEQCSFASAGQGTFLGDESTQPAVGSKLQLERVEELRIEMVCPPQAAVLARVIAALREHHPYEEPAFDIYRTEPPPLAQPVGQGRRVRLDQPLTREQLVSRVKAHLKVDQIEVVWPAGRQQVSCVGLCAGSGGSLIDKAGPIDAFITGEMKHHDVLAAVHRGIAVLLAGHTQTERPYLPTYRDRLIALAPQIAWQVSLADQPPSQWL